MLVQPRPGKDRPAPGPAERRRLPSRDRIFRAAVKAFARRGYENVSLRDLAAEVGMRAASIYNHFRSKSAILDEALRVFGAAIDARRSPDDADEVEAALRARGLREVLLERMLEPVGLWEDARLRDLVRVITRCQYHHAGIRRFLREEMFDRPQASLALRLERAGALGLIRRGLPVPFLTAELQAVLTADFYRRSLGPDGFPLDAAKIRAALALHVDFFCRAAAPD